MKTDIITMLPIVPENYDTEHIGKIDFTRCNSEMTKQERQFVNGLIRWYQPENLLEIGVSSGGGTVNLLNAISDMSLSNLTSIDRLGLCYVDGVTPVGDDAAQMFPDLPYNKWNLITGRDPSEVMDGLGKSFDFAVIDTAHLHPVESLNFLCVLPYLKDGAVLVLHDIFLHVSHLNVSLDGSWLASRILMSSMVGGKLLPKHKTTQFISDIETVNNIVAIQICPDTRKYIGNVFEALALPWEMFPSEDINNVRSLLTKHYSPAQMDAFDEAVRTNAAWILSKKSTFSLEHLSQPLRALQNTNLMFYGAGQNMRRLLKIYDVCGLSFEYPIWDINAEKIISLEGHPVSVPDFERNVPQGSRAIITIDSVLSAHWVWEKLESIGYTVISGLTELLKLGNSGGVNIQFPVELTSAENAMISSIKDNELSMVSYERLFATAMSCKYIIKNNIPGDFVECGVWRGGNAILAAGIFKLYGQTRKVWLFDTFEGFDGIDSSEYDYESKPGDISTQNLNDTLYDPAICGNSIEDVKLNFERYGLLNGKIVFVKGNILNTLENNDSPEKIAVLRLDTDFHESTKKELEVLYPRLAKGGVLMIDDYGYCVGSRKAVDEYFETTKRPFLQYIDSTGRIGIKQE